MLVATRREQVRGHDHLVVEAEHRAAQVHGVQTDLAAGHSRSGSRRHTDPRVLRSRAAVLATTLALLTERGLQATTVEAVAERSGVDVSCRVVSHERVDARLATQVVDRVLAAYAPPSR